MQSDPVRQKIRDLLWKRGLTMREASVAIGRNVSYMHGFLERNSPKVLSHRDAANLAGLLDCDAEELHHPERPARCKRKSTRPRSGHEPKMRVEPLAAVPEVIVDAAAGPGTIAAGHIEERARWQLPEAMIRYEAGGDVDAVRVLRVRGMSMEPELSDGDRLLIDTSKREPAAGGLFVLWDGDGLVVKRVEMGTEARGEPVLQLKSTNPEYGDYTIRADDAHIVGKVLWTVRKA